MDRPPETLCSDPGHATLASEAAALRREVSRLEALMDQLQGRSDQVGLNVGPLSAEIVMTVELCWDICRIDNIASFNA